MDGIRIASQQYPYSIDAHNRQRSERDSPGRTAGSACSGTRSKAHRGWFGGGRAVRRGRVGRLFRRRVRGKGARLEAEVFDKADILLKVQPPTIDEISHMKENSVLICFLQPYTNATAIRVLAARQI